jgi:hypothetical protein
MKSLWHASFAASVLAVLSLESCGSVGVALGTRTRLEQLPITSVSASLYPQPASSPGKSGRLIIVASAADGRKWTSVGPGHGTVLFDSFRLDATVVEVTSGGVVSMPSDPRVSDGKTARVRITVVGHPDVTTEVEIPLRYDVAFAAHFSGASGLDGLNGTDGMPGFDGSSGSIDPTSPSEGGRGSDGSNGTDGANGGDGEPGQSVQLWITLAPGAQTLIQARAASANREQFFLIDPNGGSLSVDANGGSGGRGGMGGKGGRGGAGGGGFPRGASGNSGVDGHNGFPGSDGAPGKILVCVDPSAQQYLDRFHFSNRSGGGVPGPAPEVRVEAVAALW